MAAAHARRPADSRCEMISNLTVVWTDGGLPRGRPHQTGDLVMTAATLSHGSSVGGERAGEETVSYNEAVIRLFVIATMFWGVIGFTAGIFIALELAFPALNLGLEWTSFGRLRPLHTSAVVFAFGGNALFRHVAVRRPAHLPRHPFGADRWWPISCSGATRYSSCWRRRAMCWASPRARNTPSRNGTPTCG